MTGNEWIIKSIELKIESNQIKIVIVSLWESRRVESHRWICVDVFTPYILTFGWLLIQYIYTILLHFLRSDHGNKWVDQKEDHSKCWRAREWRFLRARAGIKLLIDARWRTWETSPQALILIRGQCYFFWGTNVLVIILK